MASNRIVILTLAFAAVVTFYSLSELSKITSLEEHNQQRLSFEQANAPSPSSAKPISLDASALGKSACKSASETAPSVTGMGMQRARRQCAAIS